MIFRENNYETGEIIPIYKDNYNQKQLEGWAKLIKPKGKPLSFIPSRLKESDEELINYSVYSKQRWLIQWIDVENKPKIRKTMSRSEIMTQSFLKGNKCDRYLYLYVGKWSEIKKRGGGNNKLRIGNQPSISDYSDDSIIF